MRFLAKLSIFAIRLAAVVALILGVLLLIGSGGESTVQLHTLIGLIISAALLLMALLGLGLGKSVMPFALLGLLMAILLPASGMFQSSVHGGAALAAKAAHVLIAIATLGIAEVLHARMKHFSIPQ